MMRRQRDATAAAWTLMGFVLVLAGVTLRALDLLSEGRMVVLCVVGAGLLRPDYVVDLIRSWRRKNGASSGDDTSPR